MGIESNWCGCTKCHAGYGWKDQTYDFTDMTQADCLVCHDTTGTYNKKTGSCGYPGKGTDLNAIASQVGLPNRQNCGTCHWYGGGSDNAKHGDMSSALLNPSPEFDVHMGGQDFTCQECHKTQNHRIAGSSTTSAVSEGKVACLDCHDAAPHDESSALLRKLNEHGSALSCQACHIPMYAKEKFTLTYRDASRGSMNMEKISQTETRIEMNSPTGFQVKERMLRPSYAWYNGKHYRYLKGDPVDLSKETSLNRPDGSIHDPLARITPYKIIKTKQMADAEHKYLIIPHLIGKDGLMTSHDQVASAKKGMAAAGLEFSGKIAFAETVMYWRLNHEVVSGEDALSCLDCHSSDGVMDFKALGYSGDPAKVGGRPLRN